MSGRAGGGRPGADATSGGRERDFEVDLCEGLGAHLTQLETIGDQEEKQEIGTNSVKKEKKCPFLIYSLFVLLFFDKMMPCISIKLFF